jgi:hypothetical protein
MSKAAAYVHQQQDGDVWASISHIARLLGMRPESLAHMKKIHPEFPRAKEFYYDGRGKLWSVREVTYWYQTKPETRGAVRHGDRANSTRKAWRTRRLY